MSLIFNFTEQYSDNAKFCLPGVPATPIDFRVQTATSRTASLRWTKADSNGLPITNYTLWYRPENGFYVVAGVYIAGSLESYTVEGLNPATKYYFKIAAFNDKGQLCSFTLRALL